MKSATIVDYYNQCYSDYKLIWGTGKTLAMHAGFHDKTHRKHSDAVINMNRVLAKAASISPKDKVLDAGCGVGGSAIWLAENYGCSVTGITLSKKQAIMANKVVRKRGLAELVSFCLADFNHAPFPAGSFDVIWGLESICHSPDKRAFIAEAKRLLRNGGRLVIADGFLEDKRDNDHPEIRRWLDNWAVPNLATIDEFRAWLKEAGFKKIVFRDITDNIKPSSIRIYKAGVVNYPLGKLLELLKLRTKIQTGNIIGAIYQYKTLKQGLWRYGILTAQGDSNDSRGTAGRAN